MKNTNIVKQSGLVVNQFIGYSIASRNSTVLSGTHKPTNSRQASNLTNSNVMVKTQSKETHKISSQLGGKLNILSPKENPKQPNSPKLPTMFPTSPQNVAINSFKGKLKWSNCFKFRLETSSQTCSQKRTESSE